MYFIEKYVLKYISIILLKISVYLDSGGLGLGRVEYVWLAAEAGQKLPEPLSESSLSSSTDTLLRE